MMSKMKELEVPVFQAEQIPPVDLSTYTLQVTGLVDEETHFSWKELQAMPHTEVDARLTSVSGWSVRLNWNGILWREFIKHVPVRSDATHVLFRSLGDYTTGVPLSDLDHPRVLLVDGVDGEPIESEYGAPLRLMMPNLWGYKSCKWLAEIHFTDRMIPGFWETRGYSLDGEIEEHRTTDWNTQTQRHCGPGEVTEF